MCVECEICYTQKCFRDIGLHYFNPFLKTLFKNTLHVFAFKSCFNCLWRQSSHCVDQAGLEVTEICLLRVALGFCDLKMCAAMSGLRVCVCVCVCVCVSVNTNATVQVWRSRTACLSPFFLQGEFRGSESASHAWLQVPLSAKPSPPSPVYF